MEYLEFLKTKIDIAQETGFAVDPFEINKALKPHQRDAVIWALRGGRRAVFASFGLGKTCVEIEFCRQVVKKFGGKALIVCPLGVKQEFSRDAKELLHYEPPVYVRNMEEIRLCDSEILITNYERVRDGDIDPTYFTATSLDEASVLRSFGSKTYQTFLDKFKGVPYKLVATATPSPNKYKELIHYSGYLEVMDTGQALAQPLSAKILTPTGWNTMGNIKAGDMVISQNGEKTKVIGVYPQGEKEIYEINFSDGSKTKCTGEHLWATQTQLQRNACARYLKANPCGAVNKYWSVKETKEISNTLISCTGSKNHSIPMVKAVKFEKKKILLNPYLLGYLLGNGCFRPTAIYFSTSDEWIVDEIGKIVHNNYDLDVIKSEHERKDGQSNYDYAISGGLNGRKGRGAKSNKVLNAIRFYGLDKSHAWDKFVPYDYWFNSPEIRLEVLRGLMDSDGTIGTKKNHTPIFITTSEKLKDFVVFAVESFGGTAHVRKSIGRKPNGETGRLQYRVSMKLPENQCPFKLPRKAEKFRVSSFNRPIRYITSVKKCGTELAQCIMVEDEKHLYVTDDFIVTHNTRFFQRDSTKANNLTLYPTQEDKFWLWVSSWALFITKPSDLNPDYSDEGYVLPPLNVKWHELPINYGDAVDRDGQISLFTEAATGLKEAAHVKRESIDRRVAKMKEIVDTNPDDHFILWHDLEDERHAIKKTLPDTIDIYGSQDYEIREKRVIDFSEGKIRLFATKKELSGSGCNFQRFCHRAIFLGIDYEFNDFIQAIHRVHRFLQEYPVTIDIIYMENEREIKDALLEKWKNHEHMVGRMIEIVKKYGLSTANKEGSLERKLGVKNVRVEGSRYVAVNDDCIAETRRMESNSVGLIHTSIPFGNHYEYSSQYEDFGFNEGNKQFFEQMDFLTPELYRVLKPGRMAAVHVKDRVLFGNATGTGMPTIDPFHVYCIEHYMKHGFQYCGMITVVTDVVRENNQTYRLGWTEQCKDGSKMGVGCPEYILLFRKLPTDRSKAYADQPVTKSKEEYTRAQWQIDAHAYWRSSGDRLVSKDELKELSVESLQRVYREYSRNTVYDYKEHVELAKSLDEKGKLPAIFMVVAPGSWTDEVWDDINRMRTLNTTQSKRRSQMHVCPLQIDIVERIINRYSNEGDTVYDPFGGLMTVPMVAVKMKRKGIGCELNADYFRDGVGYLQAAEMEADTPTLFDFMDIKNENE